MKTYIIGHQKPDTDAVVATLAFKHLFDSMNYWGYKNSIATITHNLNPETAFVFKKFNQETPQLISAKNINPNDKIVLVDHNEQSQALEGLNFNQVTDIFDHHKVNLNLNQPIFITTKSWGSTCTIAFDLMNIYKVDIPEKLAGLMLCAILSDTVGFKSSTTTPIDKEAAFKLQKIAGIKNLSALTLEIFKAKSNTNSLTDVQLITNDYKIYDLSGQKVFINQLETVEQKSLITNKKSALIKALSDYKQAQGINLAFLVVTDVLKANSKLLIISNQEKQIAQKAFKGSLKNSVMDIGSKLSRKKDILPPIEAILNS